MNLKDAILFRQSKKHADYLAEYISDDKDRFKELIFLINENEELVASRGSWVLRKCFQRYPSLTNSYHPLFLEWLKRDMHPAVARNILGIFQTTNIDKAIQGELIDVCFNYLKSEKEAIAIRAFSISVLVKLTAIYPELKDEFRLVLEPILKDAKPAIAVRGRKALLFLNNLPQ